MVFRGFSRVNGKNLGHYSAGFTLDTYTHITTSTQKEAANTMAQVLAM